MTRGSKKLFRMAGMLSIIAVLSYAGWQLTRTDPQPVELVSAERGIVEATVINTRAGTIKACRRARLSPATGGQIISLPIREGDRVESGQVLLELWNVDLAAQKELSKQQFVTAVSQQREACILAENAKRESIRTQQLVARGFVSSQRADDADAAAQARQAACAAAAAEVERARAQIAVVQASLERTVLIAPFAGIIAQVTGELGEYVTPSPQGIPTPPAVDLIDDSCLYVSAPMDEVDAPKIRVGQVARILIDALPGQTFEGHVRRIAPFVTEIEKQARTVDVEAEFINNYTDTLLVGYSADVEVIVDQRENVLRIPTQVIRQNNKVLVLGPDDKLEERTLVTGLGNWVFTEVLEGLNESEQMLFASDGVEVTAGTHVTPKSTQP